MTKWYQMRYQGPMWLWAILVVLGYALVITVFEELDLGPAARVSVEELAEAQSSPQE